MHLRNTAGSSLFVLVLLTFASTAHAQSVDESRWSFDVGIGLDLSVNGNINSGAIGVLQGQASAILPNPYGEVYGSGLQLRFGAGYALNDGVELRGVFTYQSADADLVRLGDIGQSNLYGQYDDYKTLALDFGYRRYVSVPRYGLRVYGEGTIGIAFVDEIDVLFAAPQSNIIFDQTDFYDRTSAFTLGFNAGVLYPVGSQVDVNFQIGLRRVSGLAEVDNLVGTGLAEINDDSARLTFPIIGGVRFRF